MSNIVKNVVKMKEITTLPLFTEVSVGGVYAMAFDFNWIIPMPPSFNLKTRGMEDLAIEAVFRADFVLRYQFGRDRPAMPEAEYREQIAMYDRSVDTLVELGRKCLSNLELYGATTRRGWCEKNWGTVLNAQESTRMDSDTILFATLNCAPQKVIAQLAKMYPDSKIEHWWADEDLGYNSGYAAYIGGRASTLFYHNVCSSKAYGTYIRCWGACKCLYQDENGLWKRRNCQDCQDCHDCHGCD